MASDRVSGEGSSAADAKEGDNLLYQMVTALSVDSNESRLLKQRLLETLSSDPADRRNPKVGSRIFDRNPVEQRADHFPLRIENWLLNRQLEGLRMGQSNFNEEGRQPSISMKTERQRKSLVNEDNRTLKTGSSRYAHDDRNVDRSSVRMMSREPTVPSTEFLPKVPKSTKAFGLNRQLLETEVSTMESIFGDGEPEELDFDELGGGLIEDVDERQRVKRLISDSNKEILRLRKVVALCSKEGKSMDQGRSKSGPTTHRRNRNKQQPIGLERSTFEISPSEEAVHTQGGQRLYSPVETSQNNQRYGQNAGPKSISLSVLERPTGCPGQGESGRSQNVRVAMEELDTPISQGRRRYGRRTDTMPNTHSIFERPIDFPGQGESRRSRETTGLTEGLNSSRGGFSGRGGLDTPATRIIRNPSHSVPSSRKEQLSSVGSYPSLSEERIRSVREKCLKETVGNGENGRRFFHEGRMNREKSRFTSPLHSEINDDGRRNTDLAGRNFLDRRYGRVHDPSIFVLPPRQKTDLEVLRKQIRRKQGEEVLLWFQRLEN